MSIIQPSLPGARVLDLFAGSGALGLEAVSRGAARADLVERAPPSLRAITENVESLGAAEQVTVHRVDAVKFVGELAAHDYDVAFDRDGTAITKGDADRSPDPWRVPRANIVGGVVVAPQLVGFALVYLRQPLGLASIALAFLAVWQTAGLARVLQRSGNEARTLTITSRST